ncbi:glutaminyl-peptide cyclotransferase [Kineobactrum salinum]|uniref:Glutaminyl-peptide cyclotransferase n=1 Tax=Kineobactrum salinum TaxID=2708301 RepID=A0A6C0TWH5_9GAMM|nr:glutaminyl-peptide cyclotransferase [Kineobactrum salinum]QIB64172.1 glutaminyl-peptide cyclotransferase [Kineobactrum salinum]
MRQLLLPCCLLLALISHTVAALEEYSYRVLEQQPQPRDHYVQGLQIVGGMLYVSTGRYGQSRLLQYRLSDGELIQQRRLHPRLFGEGLTVLGERVYQLTWRARRMLVYRRAELQLETTFTIPGEGWGLTDNGRELIYTDGGHHLHFLDPADGRPLRSIAVTEHGLPLPRLNELEWIDGKVWANIWQRDRIVIIDPVTGEVEASIDLRGLLPLPERRPDTDVLNGIARNPADGSVWVTGKNWPWRYRIELVPKPATAAESR